MNEKESDVLIVGGGVGGCAAAIAVCRMGYRVIMAEETAWVGGQLTSQGVPPDEHGWIEQFGCTATYRKFREGVRQYYRDNYPLTPEAAADACLNPGNGWVSPICHEPKVALAVLHGMLAPYEESGLLHFTATSGCRNPIKVHWSYCSGCSKKSRFE
ncbi:MAG: FAD-dependent oxidoreductase [Opitutaceae bacterium]|nr:FAD-dependent oxidoreductase [Opitutaceae bacterium]